MKKYSSVLFQDAVHFFNVRVLDAFQPVVKARAALVGTEFLVDPAFERRAAFGTNLFLLTGHTWIRVKTGIHEYKRKYPFFIRLAGFSPYTFVSSVRNKSTDIQSKKCSTI